MKLADEPTRSRRLNADIDEETALLAVCAPHLRAAVEAALETGMRIGEILSLQWTQIEGVKVKDSVITWASRAEVVLPWAKTKTRSDREFRFRHGSGRSSNCDGSIRPGNRSAHGLRVRERDWPASQERGAGVGHGRPPVAWARADLHQDRELDAGVASRALGNRFELPRSAAGSRVAVARRGRTAPHDSRLVGAHEHRPRRHLSGGHHQTQHDAMTQFERAERLCKVVCKKVQSFPKGGAKVAT